MDKVATQTNTQTERLTVGQIYRQTDSKEMDRMEERHKYFSPT